MENTKHFLRYILPGIAFTIELPLFLFLSNPNLINFLRTNIFPGVKPDFQFLFTFFSFLLSSGGGGYLLAQFYHALSSIPGFNCLLAQNYTNLLKIAAEKHIIHFSLLDKNQDQTNSQEIANRLTKNGAWRVIGAIWQQMRDVDHIDKANSRIETTNDTMHSAGTALVGSVVAFILSLIIFYIYVLRTGQVFHYWWPVVPLGMIYIHFLSFCNIRDHNQAIISIILISHLEKEKQEKKKEKRTVTVYETELLLQSKREDIK